MEEERKKGEKKENSTELQKPNIEAEVYNNNKKCDWGKKKSSKASLDFIVPIKWTTTTEAGGRGKKKKNLKQSTEQVKTEE